MYSWIMGPNFLITGLPGSGKTTLIMKLAERLRAFKGAGFSTKEIRAGGARTGFEIVDLRGMRRVLAHVDMPGRERVGRYGVDVAGFERYLKAVPFLSPGTDLVIADEIGKMECLSETFTRLVVGVLDAPVTVVATIPLHGQGFVDGIKKRPDACLFTVTRENRDGLVGEIETAVRAVLPERR